MNQYFRKTENMHYLKERIKRHVTSLPKKFFIATTPGLESACLAELNSLPLTALNPVTCFGGIEFKGYIQDSYMANLSLSTANKILMRILEIKVANFRQLEKKLSDFPWELFIDIQSAPTINVTSKHSRLYHKKAISERIYKSILDRYDKIYGKYAHIDLNHGKQNLFVMLVNNRVTISLDSSGELLYKRGIKKHGGPATIRETIAAAALILAGYDYNEPLIDPMCGSGTFSIEAAMKINNIPSGWFRNFAFMQWPCFNENKWANISQTAQKGIIYPKNNFKVFASDKDPYTCDAMAKCINSCLLSHTIQVCCKNFFDFAPSEITTCPGLVVINPPYGLRIGTKKESIELFLEICKKLKKDYKNWKVALIAPHLKLLKKIPLVEPKSYIFMNGGLKLNLLTGKIA